MMAGSAWLIILLCLVAGSAIEKSNVCLVRGTARLVSGKVEMAVGILLITASASIVYYAATKLGLHHNPAGWSLPAGRTIAGAVLFALGSLLNGACAVGTVGRIARGDLGHFATFAGAFLIAWLLPGGWAGHHLAGTPPMDGGGWLVAVLALSAGVLWASRRRIHLARMMPYAALGSVAVIITDWRGNWTWTSLLQQFHSGVPIEFLAVLCFAAVLAGGAVTACFSGDFKLVRPNPAVMAREMAGGGLMVAGAIIIPGANDALSVYGVPSGSPDFVMAYVLMFFVMLGVFWLRRVLPGIAGGKLSGRQAEI